jgi:hypothetical protein
MMKTALGARFFSPACSEGAYQPAELSSRMMNQNVRERYMMILLELRARVFYECSDDFARLFRIIMEKGSRIRENAGEPAASTRNPHSHECGYLS